MNKLKLFNNMRLNKYASKEFNKWLIDLGNETTNKIPNLPIDSVEIPKFITVTNNLVETIFDLEINQSTIYKICDHIILCLTNEECFNMNSLILDTINSDLVIYNSVDIISDEEPYPNSIWTQEFLQTNTPPGMAPHKLKLKINAIVILKRTINKSQELFNGTRTIVLILGIEIISGNHKGTEVPVTKIDLTTTDNEWPIKFTRRHVQLLLGFAITINKSQGQTFNKVRIYLHKPLFSHGQLYVAFSRAQSEKQLFVNILPCANIQGHLLNDSRIFTKNIVYREVLQSD